MSNNKQIHLEIKLFYWHHSFVEGLSGYILAVELLKIDFGRKRERSLFYYSNIAGVHILKVLFFFPAITWGKFSKHGN
jgi:hypothetical protein